MALLNVAGCSGIKQSTLETLPLLASGRRNITIEIVAPTVQQIDNQHNPGEDRSKIIKSRDLLTLC